MTHTTHEALRELDRVLAEVERDGKPFDMLTFGRPDCGTAACVAGWGMRDKWFQSHGLSRSSFFRRLTDDSIVPLIAFFGLSHENAHDLFFAMDATASSQRAVIASLLATAPDNVVEGGL